MKSIIATCILVVVLSALAGTSVATHVYTTGFRPAFKISNDLFEALDPKYQKTLDPQPVSLEPMDLPMIIPTVANEDGQTLHQVKVSLGFLDLMNHIAHAKAIDRIQPGYFEKYVVNLARESTNDTIADLPNMEDPRYWSDSVMNDQVSYFGQMMGLTLGINLAHIYLGHYAKYSPQMLAGKLVPINNLITPDEWDNAVKAATRNSLDCALAPEGVEALFEAIDKMPHRPAWTAYFAPANADLKHLNKQLAKYEDDYFHGGIK